MSHEEKINYLRIAAGVCGFGFKPEQLDLLISLYELVIDKKGSTDIDQIVKIEAEVKKRADVEHRKNLLDKISEKV